MNSTNIKRSIARNGRKTSVSLEKEFWDGLRDIAALQGIKIKNLVEQIDEERGGGVNLSSAIRVFVFNQLRAQIIGRQVVEKQIEQGHYTANQKQSPGRTNLPRP